jgi:hypothetical protein
MLRFVRSRGDSREAFRYLIPSWIKNVRVSIQWES